jgi:hypothetical protein
LLAWSSEALTVSASSPGAYGVSQTCPEKRLVLAGPEWRNASMRAAKDTESNPSVVVAGLSAGADRLDEYVGCARMVLV